MRKSSMPRTSDPSKVSINVKFYLTKFQEADLEQIAFFYTQNPDKTARWTGLGRLHSRTSPEENTPEPSEGLGMGNDERLGFAKFAKCV